MNREPQPTPGLSAVTLPPDHHFGARLASNPAEHTAAVMLDQITVVAPICPAPSAGSAPHQYSTREASERS